MKKAINLLLRYRRIIIPIFSLTIFVILLSAIIFFITLDDGTYREGDMSSTPYAAYTYTSSVKFTSDGIKFIYKNEDTGTEVEMTSSEMAQVTWDAMIKAGSCVTDYLDTVEELEKLMNAEVITQYPKIATAAGGLNGTIEFKRYKTDGTSVTLQYIDKNTFDDYINNSNTGVMNYFTLDDNGNMLIGIVDESTETLTYDDSELTLSDYTNTLSSTDFVSEGFYSKTQYNVYSKTVNYKNAISKYTLPFQYLWSLIVIGDDKGVGLELAELAENSEIVISIYDNITTTDNLSTYTYTRQKKVDVSATATCYTNYGNYTDSDSWEPANEWEEGDYEVNHEIIYKNNTPIIDITKADVWIVDYSKQYTYQASGISSQETNSRELNLAEYIDDAVNPVVSASDGSDLLYYDKFKDDLEGLKKDLEDYVEENVEEDVVNNVVVDLSISSTSITSCSASYYKRNVSVEISQNEQTGEEIKTTKGVHEVNLSTVSTQKYIAQAPVNNPKIQKGTGQVNFVTILSDATHSKAKQKITSEITSWLFDLLESNPDTVNMVDLTRYLLYVVTGDDRFGVTEYDFGVYGDTGFSNATGSIYGDSIQEKVWFMLKDLGYNDISAAGAMGNIHYESGSFNPAAVEGGYTESTGGIGICQWTNNNRGATGRNTNLKNFAASRGLTWQDEDIQVEFLRGELTVGGGADGYASYQLSTTKKYYGSQLACADAWINATTVEDATKAFCYSFERPGKEYAQSSMATRISYAQQYYNMYNGMEAPQDIVTTLTGDNKSKMQSMISEAVRIANDNSYQYSQTYRESTYYYDCSSFVSRLYTQYFGISRLDRGTAGRGTDNIRANSKGSYMEVSLTSLQAGDILWRDGHVALYIGNNQTAEAASTSSGIVVRTMGTFTEAFRIIY